MKKEQWLQNANDNKEILLNLIYRYHPFYEGYFPGSNITAPAAEKACEKIRKEIKNELRVMSPSEEFEDALSQENYFAIDNILSCVWFGVPESTDCWNINGFSIMINLLEDPVEEGEI